MTAEAPSVGGLFGFQTEGSGNRPATPVLTSQVNASRGAATAAYRLRTHGEENAQGNTEGGVTLREAEARLRRKRMEFISGRDANSIHL
jgi:hypothetical protein